MPIYEYQCCSCGQVTEELQKFSDSPLTTCTGCGGELSKLISHSAFHLKGSGWYVTEYGKGNTCSPKSSETTTEKPAEAPKATAPAPATKSDE